MPGDIGLVSKLLDSILHFITDEDGLSESLLRMRLAKKKKEYQETVKWARTPEDFEYLKQLADELKDLVSKP